MGISNKDKRTACWQFIEAINKEGVSFKFIEDEEETIVSHPVQMWDELRACDIQQVELHQNGERLGWMLINAYDGDDFLCDWGITEPLEALLKSVGFPEDFWKDNE